MAKDGMEKSANYRKSLKSLAKDLHSMGSEAKTTNEEIKKLTKSLTKLFSIKKITSGIVQGIQKAVDYTEDLNLLSVAFGDTANEAYNLSKNLAEITGFDTATLNRNLATFRNLTSTLGLTNEQADLLATNLEKMSLDVSSLYNVDLDRAAYALQGMLTGQPRTIKTLTGANVTNAALQETLTASGIDRKVSSLNSAEKAIIQYLTVEKQLINSNGDLAHTLEQPQQLLRVFREQLTKAARSIGALFIPAIKAVIPVLTAILMVFNEIINVIARLFGIDMDSYWNNMSKNTKSAANNLNAIGKSAKKANAGLRAFDKLNVITTPSSSGSGVGSNLGISDEILKMLDEYDLKLDGIETQATKIRDRIMEWLGFSKDVNGEWQWSATKLLKNIYNWWKKLNVLGKSLVGFGLIATLSGIFNLIKKLAKTTVATGIKILAESIGRKGLAGTLKELSTIYPTLSKAIGATVGISAAVDGIFKLSSAIKDLVQNGASLENITDILSGLLEIISGIAIVIGTFTAKWDIVIKGIIALAGALSLDFLTAADKASESTKKYREELEKLEEQIASKMTQTYAQASRAEDLKEKLSQLVDENGKVIGSEKNVQATIEELNSILGTNYKIVGDSIVQDGNKIKSKKELIDTTQKYIDKLKAENLIEYSKEKTQKLYERNIDLKKQIKEKEDELIKSLEKSKEKDDFSYDSWAKNNKNKIDKLAELNTELLQNGEELDNYYKAIVEASDGNYKEAEKLILKSVKDTKASINDVMEEFVGNVDKTLSGVNWELIINNASITGKNAGKNFASNYVNSANKEFAKNGISLKSTEPLWASTQKKAEGGFVDSGQFFLAREAGPELVGRIGSKTAVANNDQIVDAVAQGVASAIISTGGLNSRPIVIQASGDANGLMNFIKFKQQEDNMQYGN